jgi:hypothetical protein
VLTRSLLCRAVDLLIQRLGPGDGGQVRASQSAQMLGD